MHRLMSDQIHLPIMDRCSLYIVCNVPIPNLLLAYVLTPWPRYRLLCTLLQEYYQRMWSGSPPPQVVLHRSPLGTISGQK